MGGTIVAACAVLLILEGIVPFAAPALWKDAFRRILQCTDGQIRFLGLTAIAAGLILLCVMSLF